MQEVRKAVAQIVEQIKQALNQDDIQVSDLDFYHLLPNNKFVGSGVMANRDRVMVFIDLNTGQISHSEFSQQELSQIQQRIDSANPGSSLKWIGDGPQGEFALFQKPDKQLGSMSIAA